MAIAPGTGSWLEMPTPDVEEGTGGRHVSKPRCPPLPHQSKVTQWRLAP